MIAPTFRYASQADVPALVDLIERAYRGPETAGTWKSEAHLLKGPRTHAAELAALIARADSHFLVAELDGKLAGCCLLQSLGSPPPAASDRPDERPAPRTLETGAAYFGMFAINPAIHSSGLGKTVLAEAERRVRDLWNAKAMVMTVINLRTELIGYYERRGYALTGHRHPFPFTDTTGEVTRDFDLVEMKKRLD
jgi:ribosomal protein S18 acetylase RimI-like enzyme